MKLILATNNRGKLREMREILEGTGIELLSPKEAGWELAVEETGTSYTENARLKALAAVRATGLPAAADDSGLEILALDSAPGLHSARFAGDRSCAEVFADIQARMAGKSDRRARYCCAVVCCFPDGREVRVFETTEGTISDTLRGTGGFGYDPMFLLPDGRTMAELTEEEKNAISHRGRAFRELVKKLKDGECDADK